jgi:hydrogenase expression/formation protein HypC
MCVAYPGRVVELIDSTAVVQTEGRTLRASTILVPEANVGDWVVVAAGTILQVLDPDDAREIRAMLDAALLDAPATQPITTDQEMTRR